MTASMSPEQDARFALWTFAVINVLYGADRVAPNAVKALIVQDLGLTDEESALPTTFGFLAYIVSCQIFAWKADRSKGDPRFLLFGAVALWSTATLAAGMAKNLLQLVLLRVLLNAAEAAFAVTAYPLLAEYYPQSRRTLAYAIMHAGLYFGAGLGFAAGGLLAAAFGWRASMVLCGLPGLALSSLLLRLRPPPRQGPSGAKDGEGGAGPASRWNEDYATIICQPHWLVAVLGNATVSFSVAAVSEWYPTYLRRPA